MIILLLIIAIGLGLFYVILNVPNLPGIWKFMLVFIEMTAVGQILIRRYKLPTELGLILVKSKKGIRMIEGLAKRRRIFNFLADVGNIIAYGFSAFAITKEHFSHKKYRWYHFLAMLLFPPYFVYVLYKDRTNRLTVFRIVLSWIIGMFLLTFLSSFVAPSAFVFLFQTLKLGAVEKTVSSVSESTTSWLLLAALILFVGGLFMFILFNIVLYGSIIVVGLFKTIFLGVPFEIGPGATFLLPGINLPLFEGLIALVILLVVHEGAHAVLTRIGKIPLLSSGIVFFGIIPIGAFIEPDEKKLRKLDDIRQTRVLVAGSTSNFLTSCIFFIVFVAFAVLVNNFGLMQIEYSWPASIGEFVLDLGMAPFKFVYITLGLTFALNFVVGAINLLPLPLFDGYRMVEVNVRNKNIVKALMYVTLAFFILNFVPWFFQP